MMKVRIKQTPINTYTVEVLLWYWPFWCKVTSATTADKACEVAQRIKHPIIEEIK